MKGNHTGKGGFKDHPESINTDGRPKGSGGNVSLLAILKKELEVVPKGEQRMMAELLIQSYLQNTLVTIDGTAIRDAIDRTDGKPKQTVEMHNEKDAEWLELFKEIKDEAKSETTDDPNSVREEQAEDIDS